MDNSHSEVRPTKANSETNFLACSTSCSVGYSSWQILQWERQSKQVRPFPAASRRFHQQLQHP
eukprot:scaffold2199_cov274-Prasinococcus_capsulatus_cf.AAC.3